METPNKIQAGAPEKLSNNGRDQVGNVGIVAVTTKHMISEYHNSSVGLPSNTTTL